jgi:hypothetical protein
MLERNPVPTFKQLGGGQNDDWNNRLANRVLNALPGLKNPEAQYSAANATFAGLIDMNPRNPMEGMIIGQIIAAHETATELYRRAWLADQSFEARTKFLTLADKSARTVAVLTEALDRHRNRGQQTVTVKHVTVNAEQAVVADQVVTGGGVRNKYDGEPHAKQITNAPLTPMPCPVQTDRETMPSSSDA